MRLYLLSLECKEPKSFSWEKYLEETGTQAAPARAFKVVWYTSMQIFTVLCYSSLNTDMWFCVVVFFQRPLHGFQFGMKVEAVDKRNPMLIRVATIADTEDHRLKVGDVSSWWCFLIFFFCAQPLFKFLFTLLLLQIHFDGWSSEYDYWVETDCPDLHPVGWCQKTGHPLQYPNGVTHFTTLSHTHTHRHTDCPCLSCWVLRVRLPDF